MKTEMRLMHKREVVVPLREARLDGELTLSSPPQGVVVFAHGSGSSRFSPRNQFVAGVLQEAGIGTLLFDLLTEEEEEREYYTRHLRFDIPMLARRLVEATHWLRGQPELAQARLGYFGSSTGAAAALFAAAEVGEVIGAVVSRGGRPDLAEPVLNQVYTPTLLIVGGRDVPVIELNQKAYEMLRGEKDLRIVPRATHLFEEPGTLEEVARLAAEWFQRYLLPASTST